MLKVFVYGTLKPGEANYPPYCAGKVIYSTKAYTRGKLYHLPSLGYPAMTEGEEKVEGFLLTFADSSVLANLDQLEDYDPQRHPSENEYYRQKILVYDPAGKYLAPGWSYFMTTEKVQQLGGIWLPSGCWRRRGDFSRE
ncbi:MAG: gamma-glutamylcyclotransferase [Gomphosphaeria aponina SAG 52.96 = DSM 107014]|uniref:Gamma-glutamylcyclotransferase n=1 Tax=Gomphosphaeria aponina SAG 52.96 = DSM 107014 TaxID=1521640 RepID=A0A941GQ42_9CHRO|nr:gamma-glutamylcyclotransferase [Gomphosphaeria aponina SAG 52.96 = DSM 107014]